MSSAARQDRKLVAPDVRGGDGPHAHGCQRHQGRVSARTSSSATLATYTTSRDTTEAADKAAPRRAERLGGCRPPAARNSQRGSPKTRFLGRKRHDAVGNFNNIVVRSFIQGGAPFACKAANVWTCILVPGDHLLQGCPIPNDPDRVIIDLDPGRTDRRAVGSASPCAHATRIGVRATCASCGRRQRSRRNAALNALTDW